MTHEFEDVVEPHWESLTVGDTVPNFTFEVFHKGEIEKRTMEEYRSKWLVLFFYPADFTFVCPTELQELASLYEKFQAEDTEIVSVSTDTAFAHKAWHESSPAIGTVTYPMAADPTHELAHSFGVYVHEEGVARRGTFIIDPEGVIRAFEIHDNSIGRSASETLRKIQAAKYVAEHGGNVCPASWTPGDDTLEPSTDLVGKI